jgi:hypothetical protein
LANWKKDFDWKTFFPRTPWPLLELRSVFYKPDGTILLRVNDATYSLLTELSFEFDWIVGFIPTIPLENETWTMNTSMYDYPALTELYNKQCFVATK